MLGLLVVAAAAFAESAAPPAGEEPEETVAGPARISAWQAAVLGVVEGLTEYLPVSSTGHLILTGHAMGLSHFSDPAHPLRSGLEKVPAVDAFEIVIQLGAILAVLGIYRKRVGQMALGVVGRDAAGLRLLAALAIAFLPAAVIGVLCHHWIKAHLFNPTSVIAALAVGGVLMIVIERYFWRRGGGTARLTQVDRVAMGQALVIGLAQCLAMWPGTSRSMITMLAALVVGFDMVAAAEFSFLLALPTLGAATLYEGYKSWDVLSRSAGPEVIVIGLVVSGVVAALAVKGFVRWLTGHGLAPFGVYRIALAAAVYAYFVFA
jgi:undecaprenyl-diphosphatase